MSRFIYKCSLPMSMIDKETLRDIVKKQKIELQNKEGTIKREILDEIVKWLKDKRIIILTGIRRCGKSTLLKQIMEKTLDWCYINFEDERLLDFKAQDFQQLNEVLIEIYGTTKIYFFDEIQNIDKFETFVRRLQDEGKKIIITGSNASLLSKEFGTRLTGRYKPFEVYPFSFKEYLKLKNFTINKDDFYIIERKAKLTKLLNEYLLTGGMPEYIKNKDKEYIRTLYENILYRDVIVRYSIKKEKLIKELVNMLTTNISSQFTYNSIKKSLGLGNSITVKEYISYLQNSYLLFELQKFSYSLKEQFNSPKKIYTIDIVFNYLCGLNFSTNKGKILENVVFNELKRRNNNIYYHSNKNECDFIVNKETSKYKAIQVCYNINPENRDREINGLLEAMDKLKIKQGIIITYEQKEEIEINGKKIEIIPSYKWLIE